ncbi:hypothetical protein NDU88_000950 [Pleurodeles waltl]|uniref:Uncharacterized protein n=1 Tax=Pleurodeles waltl TaxID=8319 RepID=A0AAV7NC44_PLEWA|nr:hypothetical protein NDU88_000950 [Pleurodeles waltl]
MPVPPGTISLFFSKNLSSEVVLALTPVFSAEPCFTSVVGPCRVFVLIVSGFPHPVEDATFAPLGGISIPADPLTSKYAATMYPVSQAAKETKYPCGFMSPRLVDSYFVEITTHPSRQTYEGKETQDTGGSLHSNRSRSERIPRGRLARGKSGYALYRTPLSLLGRRSYPVNSSRSNPPLLCIQPDAITPDAIKNKVSSRFKSPRLTDSHFVQKTAHIPRADSHGEHRRTIALGREQVRADTHGRFTRPPSCFPPESSDQASNSF